MDTDSFEQISLEEFDRAIGLSLASATFRRQYARYSPSCYDGSEGPDFMLHLGDLKTEGYFEAPGFFTLITGNLHVDGIVDLHNPYDKGFDEGGLFVVLGDVICDAFFNEYGKCTFVDGELAARDLLVNAFGDSALVVTKSLSTNFYFGRDLGAHVGGGVSMEYGDGYCLPIGFTNAERQAIRPRHGRNASIALLDIEAADGLHPHHFKEHLKQGKPLLKGG